MLYFFLGLIVGSVLTFIGIYYLGSLNKKNSYKNTEPTKKYKRCRITK